MKKTYTIKIKDMEFEFKADNNDFMDKFDACYVIGKGKITHDDPITIVNIK